MKSSKPHSTSDFLRIRPDVIVQYLEVALYEDEADLRKAVKNVIEALGGEDDE